MKSLFIVLLAFTSVALLAAHGEAPAGGSVRLEGCIVDRADNPMAAEVRAENGAGEVLARSASQADGLFSLEVPARSAVLLASGDALRVLRTGDTALSVEACLQRSR